MSKIRKPVHQEEEAGEAWLLPYSDLMTLLLAVFIVLFAVSKIDAAKAQQISQQFAGTMMSSGYTSGASAAASGTGSGGGGAETGEPVNSEAKSELELFFGEEELEKLEELKTELDSKLKSNGMERSASTLIDLRGLVIRLDNAVLFDSGSAEIKLHKDTLIEVAGILNTTENYIRIEGHTDNVPIRNNTYPSNWELSTARAVNVVKFFIDQCSFPPDKLIAVGYGEFKPVADNGTAEGKAKNRRIDIIVLSEKYNTLEEQNVS